MCQFASFVLTADQVFSLPFSDSHETIIEHYDLHCDGARGPNVLRVEIIPPDWRRADPVDRWIYRLDQDELPEWFNATDCERRTREALADRAARERWFVEEIVGTGRSVTVGYRGSAIAGHEGRATAGDFGRAAVGDFGFAIAGAYGRVVSGHDSFAFVGSGGTAIAGYRSHATAASHGSATTGDCGIATAGPCGRAVAGFSGKAVAAIHGCAAAGECGEIQIEYQDRGLRYRTLVGYVGENGIEANVAYRIKDGKFVKAEAIKDS